MGETRHVLYRMRDKLNGLLYVGITMNPVARFGEHKAVKDWWPEVARIDIAHFPSRAELVAAEERAIRTERPRYNVQHNRVAGAIASETASNASHRTIRGIPDDLWEDCVAIAKAKTGDNRGGLSGEIREFLVRYRSRNARQYLDHAATPSDDASSS